MADPPLCRCHGEPMEWNKDSRPRFLPAGGYWRCKVKHAAARARYEASAKGKAKNSRYKRSDLGRASDKRYAESPMGSLVRQLNAMARVRVRY